MDGPPFANPRWNDDVVVPQIESHIFADKPFVIRCYAGVPGRVEFGWKMQVSDITHRRPCRMHTWRHATTNVSEMNPWLAERSMRPEVRRSYQMTSL